MANGTRSTRWANAWGHWIVNEHNDALIGSFATVRQPVAQNYDVDEGNAAAQPTTC